MEVAALLLTAPWTGLECGCSSWLGEACVAAFDCGVPGFAAGIEAPVQSPAVIYNLSLSHD